MAVKSNKQTNGNILYILDTDAKALGIIEGSAQKVYIDGKEIDVAFVDEHEVIPASLEEKKLYRDATKIAAKYESVYGSEDLNLRRNLVGNKNGNLKPQGFKSFFASKTKERSEIETTPMVDDSRSNFFAKSRKQGAFSKISASDPRYCAENEILSHSELDIIQAIITKSKNQNATKTGKISTSAANTVNTSKALTTVKKSKKAKKPVKSSKVLTTAKPAIKTNALTTVKKTKKLATKNNSK